MLTRPLIQSPRTRSVIIGVLMSICLLGSLALAQMLIYRPTLGRRIALSELRAGDVTVAFPDGWQRVDSDQPYRDANVYSVHVDAATGRRLMIAALHDQTPRSPVEALEGASQTLLDRRPMPLPPLRSFRVDTLVGLQFVGYENHGGDQLLHLLAVVTEDARHYHIVWLSCPNTNDDRTNRRLHDMICQSLVSHRWRSANADELLQVGLRGSAPVLSDDSGVQALMPIGLAREAVVSSPLITFIASDGPNGLAMLRLLLTIDTGGTDAGVLPPPEALMGADFSYVMGRRAQPQEITRSPLSSGRGWRAVFATPHGQLVREVWYVPLRTGRAALLETLADKSPRNQRRVHGWVNSLIDSIDEHPSDDLVGPVTDIDTAVERGNELARRIRDDFGLKTQPRGTYSIVQHNGRQIGFGVHRVTPRVADHALPVRGWTRQVFVQDDAGQTRLSRQITYDWQATTDVSALTIDQRLPINTGDNGSVYNWRRLELIDRRIIVKQRIGDQPWQTMAEALVGESYVPPLAEDDWPLDLLQRQRGQSAIMWFSRGLRAPVPFWVEAHEDEKAGLALWLRPLMGLDPSCLVLDRDGRVERLEVNESHGRPLGAAHVSVVYVDRETLLQTMPEIRAHIEHVETESSNHE